MTGLDLVGNTKTLQQLPRAPEPAPEQSTFSIESHSVLTTLGGGHHCLHLTDKETKAKGRLRNTAKPQA